MRDRFKVRGSRFEEGSLPHDGEQGYMLLGLIVAIFLILLALTVAASDMAQTIRRERERESARRANQYVRAIRLFYLKNGNRYPATMKALENTNMIRFLRQQYTDPLTGKDYRLIGVGQNKTTPTGFFGEPLGGIASAGLGSAAGMQPALPGQAGAAGAGGTNNMQGAGGTLGAPGQAGAVDSTSSPSTASGAQGNPFTTGPFGTPTGTSGTIGPFMGVGTDKTGPSILEVNQQSSYEMWEFLYDPRIEKLKAAAALNGSMGSVGAGALGQTPGTSGLGGQSGASGFGGAPGSGGASNSSGPGGSTPPTSPPGPQ